MSYTTDDYDIEKQLSSQRKATSSSGGLSSSTQSNVQHGTTADASDAAAGSSLSAKLMHFAGKFGVEQRGIERVPEDERAIGWIFVCGKGAAF